MSGLRSNTKASHSLGNESGPANANSIHARYPGIRVSPRPGCSVRSRGTTTVEFAITAAVFFLLLFMIVDFALYSFIKLTMQHAVREGARYAVTGQVDLDPKAKSNRRRAVIQKIRDHSMGFFDDVLAESDIKVTDSRGKPVSGFGAPGESIVITFNCAWPIYSPFTQAILRESHYNFSVRASMRNEDFPGGSP